jgi:hypothetical protein
MRAAWARRSRTVDGQRECLRCHGWFPATTEFFHRSGSGGEFLHSYCKPCANIINKANRDARPNARLREHLRRRFGITPEDYDAMFAAQGGVCAICGSPPRGRRLSVDHDHDTDEVRGLLCSTCNAGIGSMRDDPELLRRAIAYLEAHHV